MKYPMCINQAIHRLVLAMCFLVFLSTGATAQKKDTYSTKFHVVGLVGSVKEAYFLNDGKVAELQGLMTHLGPAIKYKGSRKLVLYKDKDFLEKLQNPEDGQEPPVPIASVDLPVADKVLLVYAASNKRRLKPFLAAFSLSSDSLKAGDYQFYNFSNKNIGLILGEQNKKGKTERVLLKPGKTQILSKPEWRKEAGVLLLQMVIPKEDKKWKLVYSAPSGHSHKKRNIIMVFDGGKRRALIVRRFFDFPGLK